VPDHHRGGGVAAEVVGNAKAMAAPSAIELMSEIVFMRFDIMSVISKLQDAPQ
jgi:hypothetical protein